MPLVQPAAGHFRCPDGISTCPLGTQCNPGGVGRDACLAPGATRCDFYSFGKPSPIWCTPPQVCDYQRGRCAEKVAVPAGHQLCPDGLSTCPTGTTCNPGGVGRDACLAPGAVRCDFYSFGKPSPIWCTPPQVCDYQRMQCADKATGTTPKPSTPPQTASGGACAGALAGKWRTTQRQATGSNYQEWTITPDGKAFEDQYKTQYTASIKGRTITITGPTSGAAVITTYEGQLNEKCDRGEGTMRSTGGIRATRTEATEFRRLGDAR